ncbi:MAG TPA: ribosome maturation factor RimM [Rhodocyclaceae bacterium]|nr:ribosome maturation factor RimM [Rhodocyclaceae bacterium]
MIVLGRLIVPYGVNGWLKFHHFGDDPLALGKMPQWWLGTKPESVDPVDWKQYPLRGCKLHGKGIVVAFEGVDNRSDAESIEGLFVAAPRETWPAPSKGEYYWNDLTGLRVVNHQDVTLGVVRGLIETGAHAVLDVVDGEVERLIPFVSAYVQKIDPEKGEIRVEWGVDW